VKPAEPDLPTGKAAEAAAAAAEKERAPTKKRGRQSKTEPNTEAIASAAIAQDGLEDDPQRSHMPPPTTPNKRRKLNTLPPITPTPSAVGFMTSTSATKPTHTPQPPPTRNLKPYHTNATLLTPGGGTATFKEEEEEDTTTSPSKPSAPTNKTLLSTACSHLLSVDPTLAPIIAAHTCKPFTPEGLAEKIDPFRSLASGIIAQQVSGAAAKSIKNKFVGLFDEQECVNGFPSPEAVVGKELEVLRTAGLSQRKAEYISGLAEKFVSGELGVKMLMEGSDEDVRRELVAVRGLGMWSVEMFMCFGLKRVDVFSTGEWNSGRGCDWMMELTVWW
jgi:DNA-3-methyladenine glycosylase II